MKKFTAIMLREYLNESIDINEYPRMIENLKNNIESKYPVVLSLQYSKLNHVIILSKIVINKEQRDGGIGTSVMKEICDFADKLKLRIALTPSSDFGGSKSRLINFYKGFGFKNYKDYDFKETMVRLPN